MFTKEPSKKTIKGDWEMTWLCMFIAHKEKITVHRIPPHHCQMEFVCIRCGTRTFGHVQCYRYFSEQDWIDLAIALEAS